MLYFIIIIYNLNILFVYSIFERQRRKIMRDPGQEFMTATLLKARVKLLVSLNKYYFVII